MTKEWRDHPTTEEQVAVLYERMGNFMEETRRANTDIRNAQERTNKLLTDLLSREKERDQQLNELLHDREDMEVWRNKHDDWHGPNDQQIKGRIGSRIDGLENVQHDSSVKRGVWLSQWKALTASAGAGAALVGIVEFIIRSA